MAIDVETKDCTALTDAELGEMADICADGPARFDIGMLSKQREEWVLVSLARDGNKLHGFSFCTLERIGGTPCVLVGLASVKRTSKRETVLRAIMADQYRRAVLAFPDEDVLIATKIVDAAGYQALRGLVDVVPRPDHRASGEERAWGRRLAKRFGADNRINDRSFQVQGDGDPPACLDHEALKPDSLDPAYAPFLDGLDHGRGDYLIAFGWAMAEDLASGSVGR